MWGEKLHDMDEARRDFQGASVTYIGGKMLKDHEFAFANQFIVKLNQWIVKYIMIIV